MVETFSEFKEFKNIDRETMMRILEDVFHSMLIKKFGEESHFDIFKSHFQKLLKLNLTLKSAKTFQNR